MSAPDLSKTRVVVLSGEEFQRLQRLREILDTVVDPGTRDFNLDTFLGDSFRSEHLPAFLDAIATFPMMAERRVVVVRDFKTIHPETRKKIVASLGGVPESTLVIIEDEEVKPAVKAPKGAVLKENFKPVYDNHLPGWVKERFRKRGLAVDDEAVALLVNNVSGSLGEIDNEIEKVTVSVEGRDRVTRADMERVVGQFRHDTPWNLRNAVFTGDFAKAVEIMRNLMETEKRNQSFFISTLATHAVQLAKYNADTRRGVPHNEAMRPIAHLPFLWKLNEYGAQAKMMSDRNVRRAVMALAAADSRMKKDAIDPMLLMDILVPTMLPRKRSGGSGGRS